MSIVTIRIPDYHLNKVEELSKKLRISRNAYINKAITEFNADTDFTNKKKMLITASSKVSKNSMRINKEFSAIEYDREV